MGLNNQIDFISIYKMKLYDFIIAQQHFCFRREPFIKGWKKVIKELFSAEKIEVLNMQIKNYLYHDHHANHLISNEIKDLFGEKFIIRYNILQNTVYFSQYSIGIHLGNEKKSFGYLFIKMDHSFLDSITEDELISFISVSIDLFKSCENQHHIVDEEHRYKELFRVTEKFHSSMDIEYVLDEIISTLERVFPSYTYLFLLSIEYVYDDLPIENFDFETASSSAMEAYLNGNSKLEVLMNGNSNFYVPLKGKQGVYGVLQVKVPERLILKEDEKEFIRLLANTGGSAIENAKLYEQSRRLISDLQLINETSHQLNSNLRFSDTIQFLHSQIVHSFNAAKVGFVFINDSSYHIIEGSSATFFRKDGKQYIDYVVNKIIKEKDSLYIGDTTAKLHMKSSIYQSLMAVPMIEGDELKGFCIVLKKEKYGFTFEMYKLLQSLIHHSTLALTNSMLREKLEKLVITDHLTKLYSRNYLDETISHSFQNDARGVFILIDIDNFKKVNDTLGHQVGDEVIVQVAKLMKKNIRQSDVAARWGGEELVIYLSNLSLEDGISVAHRLVKEVAITTKPRITISCGISYWSREKNIEVKNLFNLADEALYIAKKTGKNKVVVYK
ncbi:diguanylate cyclase (GGDEF)-like protein [Oikeobacillus pervagus]|uniref:Diguanylate cyclase (GGDEF)-like protein n=1 Tax=Oikeobacillus pervagus TaxID=1325931 RepID=A0AAJ1WJ46_9BACI|nr:diguanylate cyclase [Oikeobacillus pervagus]MDQ0215023.1 diguanylate cyclase (GGDEF)-like protein [Oikeobacillus pervagus]